MKKTLLIAVALLSLWACGNKTKYQINGDLVPVSDGKVIMYKITDGQPVPIDTSKVEKGKFNFEGEVTMPELRLMSMEGNEKYIAHFFVEPGKIDMTIHPDSFEANVITGSASQDIYKKYMDEIQALTKSESDLNRRFGQARATNNEDEMNAVRFEYETMVKNTKLYSKNFIKQNNATPVAAYVYLMNFFEDAEVGELDSIVNVFKPFAESEFVKAIKGRADQLRATGVGAIAPDFTLNNVDGVPQTLSSLKGKVVLIDFWASWCQPCMAELPNVIAQYKAFKDKGFEIYGVSLDRNREAWAGTIAAYQLGWVQGWDLENDKKPEVAEKYGVTGIPHTVLIDRDGKIVAKNLRGPALQTKLAELLK